MPSRPFHILSLDGGGIKGVFSAAVLASIEEDLKIRIDNHFDLITGTSTGGIIALGIGLGLRPREILEFYLTQGPKIFSGNRILNFIQHWIFRKYSQKPLETALRSCFKDLRLGDSKKMLVIPSYNVGEDDVYIFRTAHHDRLRRDFKVPAWKVALATSAAPTFFPAMRGIDRLRLIDGGVWANNPTMVGIIEAYGTLNIPLESIRVLSIGTSEIVTKIRGRLDSGGIISWGLGNAAVDVIMRGQSIGANNQATFLLGKDKVERLNPKVSADEFSLDGIRKVDDLVAKAAHHSRIFIPTFQEKFQPHIAVEFSPIHT